MGITDFFKRMLTGEQTIQISSKDIEKYLEGNGFRELVLQEFAIHCAISLIGNAVSKCEFRTFIRGKETFGQEYYLWNYEPNRNQNSTQFIQEMISTLIRKNECLIVEIGGQRIIAEGYTKEEFALKDYEFSNVYRKGMTFNKRFKMRDVIFLQYSNKNVRNMLDTVTAQYQELLKEAIEHFENASGEKGVLKIDTAAAGQDIAGKSFEEVMEDLMNNRFKRYFGSKNAVLPLFNGYEYERKQSKESRKSTSELKDVTDLADEILRVTALAFNIPPAVLLGNVADITNAVKNLLTFCIDPLAEMISEEITRKIYGKEVINKSYLRIDTTSILHKDIFEISSSIDKLLASSMYNVDELRRKAGDEELNTEHSKKYYITKNYAGVGEVEGGDKNAKNTNQIRF